MTPDEIKALFLENLVIGFCLGITVWFVTWGLNRVYLTYKKFTSF